MGEGIDGGPEGMATYNRDLLFTPMPNVTFYRAGFHIVSDPASMWPKTTSTTAVALSSRAILDKAGSHAVSSIAC